MIGIVVGFGTAGKYYLELFKKFKIVKKVYVIEKDKNIIIKESNFIKRCDLSEVRKNLKLINFAIISTPSYLHYKYAKYFLENNIEVLIEKPFVLKLDHAKKLSELSIKKKLRCWVTFQNRHNLAITKLKKEIKNNSLGKINLVDCSLFWHRNKKYYQVGWRGKYKTDGGVLANQAIHLLDALIYIFGKVINFNAIAGFNKKKLNSEDLILINSVHKGKIYSSFKATTRANKDYRSAIDVFGEKGRILVNGISLNSYNYFKGKNFIIDKKNSEEFELGKGPISGMGNGHIKILKEFLNKKKSSKSLEIQKNIYLLKLIHSIYSLINSKNKTIGKVKNKQSIWGI